MANTHSLRVASSAATTGGEGIITPSNSAYNILTSNARTIEMWIKVNSIASTPGLWERWGGSSKNLLIRLESSGLVSAYPGSSGTTLSAGLAQSTTDVNDGAWHHIAVTWSGSVLKMYIDTLLEDTGGSVSPGSSTDQLGLAGSPINGGSGSNFDGWISHIRIWDVERTQSQIAADWKTNLVGNESNLLYNWKLNNAYTGDVSGNPTLTAEGTPTFVTDVPFTGGGGGAAVTSAQAVVIV